MKKRASVNGLCASYVNDGLREKVTHTHLLSEEIRAYAGTS